MDVYEKYDEEKIEKKEEKIEIVKEGTQYYEKDGSFYKIEYDSDGKADYLQKINPNTENEDEKKQNIHTGIEGWFVNIISHVGDLFGGEWDTNYRFQENLIKHIAEQNIETKGTLISEDEFNNRSLNNDKDNNDVRKEMFTNNNVDIPSNTTNPDLNPSNLTNNNDGRS